MKPFGQTIYAFAALLLVSSAFLSFAAGSARRSMRKYTLLAAMSAHAQTRGPAGADRPPSAAATSWSLGDRIGLAAAWAAGILLCLIAGAIVLYMLVRGLQYLQPLGALQPAPSPASTRARAAASSTRSWGR